MNTVSKRFFLTVLAVGALLIGALSVGLDFYVSSQGVRKRLEEAAQRKMGLPVKIGGMHYSLWSGLRATGVTLAAGAPGAEPSSLSLPSVSARMALWPLFSGRVVVKRLVFTGPSLVLAQNAEGRWQWPLGAIKSPPEHAKHPKHGSKGFKGEVGIRAVRIENARFFFVDKKGRNLGILEGVTVECLRTTLGKAEGNIAVERVTLRNGLTLEAFHSPFLFNDDSLSLSPMDARLAEGSVGGRATIGTAHGQPPFTVDLNFAGVNLNQLMTELGESKKNGMAGTLHGSLDLCGLAGEKKSVQGTGYARLRGARMDQIPLLQLIGSALQMDVSDMELRQAQLDLRVGEEKVFVDSLVMESPNISLNAKGTSAFDGKLDLAARMAINARLSRQLPGWVAANFQPVPGGDWRDIGFGVTGTLARPETDLLQMMVGQKLGNQFMNLLQSVTGKHKKKPGDKKNPEPSPAQEEGAAQPSATP